LAEEQKSPQEQETLLWVDEKGKIIEPVFADYFLSLHPMKCFHDKLFTVDGIIDDESGLKSEIYGLIRRYVTSSVARKIDMLLQVIKLSCLSDPPEIQTDRIHVANGTYFTDGRFFPEKEYCMNRLPVAYDPDAPKPVLASIRERTAL
jgi:putative DNA primase/helicase